MMQLTIPSRSLTFSWEDPVPARARIWSMPGLESIRAVQSGDLPQVPIAGALGMELTKVEPGNVTFSFTPTELWENPMGTLHGGIIGVLLDSAMGMAVLSTLEQGVLFTTLEYKINFVRPVFQATGQVTAEGLVLHSGKSQAVVEGRLLDANGKLYAMASSTCAIIRPQADAPEARAA